MHPRDAPSSSRASVRESRDLHLRVVRHAPPLRVQPPAVAPGAPPAPGSSSDAEWRSYGHDAGGMRYSSLAQIDRSNVTHLARAWSYHTGELDPRPDSATARDAPRAPPLSRRLRSSSTARCTSPRLVAPDRPRRGTERERWVSIRTRRAIGSAYRGRIAASGTGRGAARVARRKRASSTERPTVGSWPLDAHTGRPVTTFGDAGAAEPAHRNDRRRGIVHHAPCSAIWRDLVIIGALVPETASRGPSGDVRAFDVRTGAQSGASIRCRTRARPATTRGSRARGATAPGRTSGRSCRWTSSAVSSSCRSAPPPPTSTAVTQGRQPLRELDRCARRGHGSAALAPTARASRHLGLRPRSAPALVTIRRDNREIPAIVQMTKSGVMFVLDRRTGEPLFPIEERPMPASHVPGEQAWPTQPYPVKPAPLVRHTAITADDITDVTPESRAFCTDLFGRLGWSGGAYLPLDTLLGVWFPGTLGGATWSGASIDPQLGYAFVNVNEVGAVGAMRKKPAARRRPTGNAGRRGGLRAVLGSERSPLPASAVGEADRGESRRRATSRGPSRSASTTACSRAACRRPARRISAARSRRRAASCSSAARTIGASAPSIRAPARSCGSRGSRPVRTPRRSLFAARGRGDNSSSSPREVAGRSIAIRRTSSRRTRSPTAARHDQCAARRGGGRTLRSDRVLRSAPMMRTPTQ